MVQVASSVGIPKGMPNLPEGHSAPASTHGPTHGDKAVSEGASLHKWETEARDRRGRKGVTPFGTTHMQSHKLTTTLRKEVSQAPFHRWGN